MHAPRLMTWLVMLLVTAAAEGHAREAENGVWAEAVAAESVANDSAVSATLRMLTETANHPYLTCPLCSHWFNL